MKQLSVVIPTYNEKENINKLISLVKESITHLDYEIVVVDDNSPDGTWRVVKARHAQDPRIKYLRRIGRKGLSSAVLEGVLLSEGNYIAVMDADLQHDETWLGQMVSELEKGADVVIGSRYCEGGGIEGWNANRKFISRFATTLAMLFFRHKLSDPMSGFFAMKRQVIEQKIERLKGVGFKILLEILAQYRPEEIQICEVPYVFKKRLAGNSKLTPSIVIQLLEFLYDEILGGYIPIRFVKYVIVGSGGALLHFAILFLCYRGLNMSYYLSLICAIEWAIILNYSFNNIWTFRDARLKKSSFVFGLIKNNILCSIGGGINFFMSNYFIIVGFHWIAASLLGAVVGVLWNYNLNKVITWRIYT